MVRTDLVALHRPVLHQPTSCTSYQGTDGLVPGGLHLAHREEDVELTVVRHAADDVAEGTEQSAPRGSIPGGTASKTRTS